MHAKNHRNHLLYRVLGYAAAVAAALLLFAWIRWLGADLSAPAPPPGQELFSHDAASQGFDERQAGNDSTRLTHGNGLRTHHKVSSGLPGVSFSTMPADARYRNGGTNCRGSVPVSAIRSLECDLTDDLTMVYGRGPFQNCPKSGR